MNHRYGGKKSFGGKPRSGGRARQGHSGPQMHKTTCGDCGVSCEVPFRPNGKRPVLCRDCFGGGQNSRPMKRAPRSESRFADRGPRTGERDFELKAINKKLDAIITLLESIVVLVEEEEDDLNVFDGGEE